MITGGRRSGREPRSAISCGTNGPGLPRLKHVAQALGERRGGVGERQWHRARRGDGFPRLACAESAEAAETKVCTKQPALRHVQLQLLALAGELFGREVPPPQPRTPPATIRVADRSGRCRAADAPDQWRPADWGDPSADRSSGLAEQEKKQRPAPGRASPCAAAGDVQRLKRLQRLARLQQPAREGEG